MPGLLLDGGRGVGSESKSCSEETGICAGFGVTSLSAGLSESLSVLSLNSGTSAVEPSAVTTDSAVVAPKPATFGKNVGGVMWPFFCSLESDSAGVRGEGQGETSVSY